MLTPNFAIDQAVGMERRRGSWLGILPGGWGCPVPCNNQDMFGKIFV
jgi:hypothetical protein